MDRLTMRNSDGSVSQPLNFDWAAALERLAAYEDTGLEPEEIAKAREAMKSALALACEVQSYRNAEKDGRLVVLPCKFGGELWIVVTKRAKLHLPEYSFVKKSRLTWNNLQRVLHDFRKTVFLTREEAEAALKGCDEK